MSSSTLPRAGQRASRLPRATIWVAGTLSIVLHCELGWRLWHLQPSPDGMQPPEREPLSEWTIDLEPVPPPVVAQAEAPVQSGTNSVAVTTPRPKKKRRQPPPTTAQLPAADVPMETPRRDVTAADFQAQLQAGSQPSDDWQAAAQAGAGDSAATGTPGGRAVLDLRLRAGPQDAARVVSAVAGALGAPTRGDTEKVGDIHSAMLFNQWNDRHHGRLFHDCHQRDPAETMAIYAERCGRAPPAQ